ncbi:MAG: SAM-dependent methyltransferase [Rhodobiaceae bacterium]|nr:SAM-dependent methyltransferase [Rhodobiaceae bacterium]
MIDKIYNKIHHYGFFPKKTKHKLLASLCGMKLHCPICGNYFRKMKRYGPYNRRNAQCQNCGSLERYRWLYFWLQFELNNFSKTVSILDIAPNSSLNNLIRGYSHIDYETADITDDVVKVDIVGDLTNFPQKDSRYDYILLLEVLEHIIDDKKALSECYRLLRPNGKCIITVPIDVNKSVTEMDTSLTSDERLKKYGQIDHVRIYGNDFFDFLNSTNFKKVTRLAPNDLLTDAEMQKYSIKNKYNFHDYETCNDIFICEK